MWRDRTNLNKYAVGASGPSSTPYTDHASEDSRGLLSAGAFDSDGDAVIEMDLLPPRWADISAEITDLLADIALKGQKLDKLHQKHVLPGFNDDDAKRVEERQIEQLTQEMTKGFHECHRCIQRIEQMSDADRSFSQSTLQAASQQKMMHQSSNDAVIAQREREIEDIAQGIIELSDLFRDLQTMVIDQGTMLDRIDYNVERMHTDVKGAEREVKIASGYQRRTTKRKIILLLFLIVAGLFILLLIKPKGG
ncbi:syntaxin 16 [Geosmithia morbida]|uniref:Syntaxin 16 n=1 Tax=Geosmithia morbida TaxID=1094350 RepID=A0A9P5D3H3_9HYPO|nr:syntaxin 16 [Geosmithia morbida]KAF4121790.1 syntaxin 16 [Geosmithia morbida]